MHNTNNANSARATDNLFMTSKLKNLNQNKNIVVLSDDKAIFDDYQH